MHPQILRLLVLLKNLQILSSRALFYRTDCTHRFKFPTHTLILIGLAIFKVPLIIRSENNFSLQTNDRRMFEMFETLNKALENAFVELFFPYIYNWIPGFTGWDHFLQHSKEVKELIFETIHEHKKTRVVGRPRVYYSCI